MTNEQKLKQIIDRAVKGGWDGKDVCSANDCVRCFLFNKDFAKAYWGENWRLYLQQCVTSDDVIDYYFTH